LPHLPDFLASHPQIQIEVQLDDNIANLADRGIDLAIRSGAVDEDAGYVAVELLRFPWVACATPEYLTAHGTPQAPHELLDHAQIGYRNKSTGQIDNWLFSDPGDATPVRYTPCARHVFDDGQAAWSMVCAGLGIAWAPAWLGIDDLRCGRVIEILKPWRAPPSPLFAVRLQRRLTPLRTHQVMQFIASLPAAWQV
jgi:DNA-binding transcriptional LysR family regulator